MSKFKKVTAFVVALVMVLALTVAFTGFSSPAQAAAKIAIYVDGTKVTTDVNPVPGNDVLVSLQTVSYGFGADTKYNASKHEAIVSLAGGTYVFTMGSTNYTLNGNALTALVAPVLVSKKPMVPIKAIAEGMGGSCSITNNKVQVKYFSTMKGSIKIDGSTTVQPIAQDAANKLLAINSGLSISVAGGGSGVGVNDVKAGTVDLGNSSRTLTADEQAVIQGIYRIARDGIAIIVNPKNAKIKKLTKQQAADIFLGNITNWSQVGGDNAAIIVETRETGSGTLTTLSDLLLSKKTVVATATPNASSALIRQAVAKNKYAIGFDSIGFLNKSVKAVALNNIMPTVANVNNGTYALGRDLFTLSKQPARGIAAMFVDYLRTKTCQDNIVKKDGYIAVK